MNRSALMFGLSSVVALAGLVGACSSTTTTINDGPEGGTPVNEAGAGKETGTGGGKDSSTPIDTDSSVAPTGDEACAAETTRQACGSCCIKNHPAGAKAIQDSVEAGVHDRVRDDVLRGDSRSAQRGVQHVPPGVHRRRWRLPGFGGRRMHREPGLRGRAEVRDAVPDEELRS
jgi:hypothetical protein